MHLTSACLTLIALGRLASTAVIPRAAGDEIDLESQSPNDQETREPTNQGSRQPNEQEFPRANDQQLLNIERQANGRLPDGPPPRKLERSSLTAFQLVVFNENFEVAFFSSLLENITSGVSGYAMGNRQRSVQLVDVVKTVVAVRCIWHAEDDSTTRLTYVKQEKLHVIVAQKILRHFDVFVPTPCKYQFGTANLRDAISLASTFTDVVLGTLQDASQLFAKNGDDGPVRTAASIIGQEGEQNGYYRSMLGRKPAAQPFLTTSTASFAYSALQAFVLPDRCPWALSGIPIPIYRQLNVVSGKGGQAVQARDQVLEFAADLTDVRMAESFVGGDGDGLYVTYLTGQRQPFSVPISRVRWDRSRLAFEANFPYRDHQMDGLSIAALTRGRDFRGPDDVPAATLASPGLIQVFEPVRRSERMAIPSLDEEPESPDNPENSES